MKMDSNQMRRELEKRLAHPNRAFEYDRKNEQLRIEHNQTGKGMTVSISGVVANWHEQKDKAIDEIVYYVEEGLQAMESDSELSGKEKKIYPVIRSTSFPLKTKEEIPFIVDEHTAETRIYYALDLGNTYRLIDEQLLMKEQWNENVVKEMALFNVRSLSTEMKKDEVAGNSFYFLNKNMNGTMAVAVPHQDVLIIADIKNDTGYDILAQMTMSFFASGHVPITALSFLYEDGGLEPIFILGKNKKK